LRDPYGDIFRYNPATDRSILDTLCWIYIDDHAYVGVLLVAVGVLTLACVWWSARERRQPTGGLIADAPSSAAVCREAYWRQQGWVPADELEGPPPGWKLVEPTRTEPSADT
jgi:hypothetical protein